MLKIIPTSYLQGSVEYGDIVIAPLGPGDVGIEIINRTAKECDFCEGYIIRSDSDTMTAAKEVALALYEMCQKLEPHEPFESIYEVLLRK